MLLLEGRKMSKRTWLQRWFFGAEDNKYDELMAALDGTTSEAKALREELQRISSSNNPLDRLVDNMRRASAQGPTTPPGN